MGQADYAPGGRRVVDDYHHNSGLFDVGVLEDLFLGGVAIKNRFAALPLPPDCFRIHLNDDIGNAPRLGGPGQITPAHPKTDNDQVVFRD